MKAEVFKTSEAIAYSGAMEADTISKHGKSCCPKSHTSRNGNILRTIFFAILISCVVFTGCDRDDNKELNTVESKWLDEQEFIEKQKTTVRLKDGRPETNSPGWKKVRDVTLGIVNNVYVSGVKWIRVTLTNNNGGSGYSGVGFNLTGGCSGSQPASTNLLVGDGWDPAHAYMAISPGCTIFELSVVRNAGQTTNYSLEVFIHD